MIMKVATQIRKDKTEMFLFDNLGIVEKVVFDTSELTDTLEEGNAPTNLTVQSSQTIAAEKIVQCVECQKLIAKDEAKGEPDKEVCLNSCE